MPEPTYTPLPWKKKEIKTRNGVEDFFDWEMVDFAGDNIAYFNKEADADLGVHACNSHYELVEALGYCRQTIKDIVEMGGVDGHILACLQEKVATALAKAGE